ncbi:helix-turn-helix domain-containing protein [Streptomyces sp. NPDC058625]|uniref:helix-turn-helix domain-containing protein n=1 Tax=Streptomyces sp. NPDC058625 TaxID=3346564 RepID=UPI00364BC56E
MDKEFRGNVRPHMRNLATALQLLCRYLRPDEAARSSGKRLTQAKAARRIHCGESSLSRYLSGQSMPDLATVKDLHREACQDAGGKHLVSVPLDALILLHKEAETERRCRGDEELTAEVDALAEQLRVAESERAALRQEVAKLRPLRDEVTVLRMAVEELRAVRAGLRARLAARAASGPLPVPRRRGDRQRMRKDVAAVRNLALQAGKLDADGRAGAALSLLRRSAEILNPLETAGVLLLLRQQQHDELANNLIHVYGRDQGDQDVLHVALTLHEQGSADDAGAILQAALG